MATALPIPLYRFFKNDASGLPRANGSKVYTKVADTNIDKVTYSNAFGSALNTNPIILNANGECVIYFDVGAYDLIVTDPDGSNSVTIENVNSSFSSGAGSVSTISGLRALAPGVNDIVFTLGYYSINDGGKGEYYWNASSTAADNGGTVIKPTSLDSGSPGRWFLNYGDTINFRQFGMTGDGTTSDNTQCAALISAISTVIKTVIMPSGAYKLTSNQVFPSTITLRKEKGAYFTSSSAVNVTIDGDFEYTDDLAFSGGITAILASTKVDHVITELWGALGDDSTDDVNAIQKAITAYKNIYFLPTKTYKFRPITIPSDRKLFADGAVLKPIYESSNTNITISGSSNVYLYGLKLLIPNNNITIHIKSSSNNVKIENCYFGAQTAGIPGSPTNIIYLGDCTNVKILNNYFYECLYQVIQETGKRPNSILIEGNSFIKGYGDAVLQNNDSSAGIARDWICTNNIIDQTDNGLTFNQTECRGISFTSLVGGVIANNTFIAVKGDAATHLENVNDCIVEGNIYRDNIIDILHSGVATRLVLYVTPSNGSAVTGTITFSAGGTASIIWYDSATGRINIGAVTGSYAVGNTYTCTGGGAGTLKYVDASKVSVRVSHNLFYKSSSTSNNPTCIQLNVNVDDSRYIMINDNTFNSDGNAAYNNAAINGAFCSGATIIDNLFKGFYYAIWGGVGSNSSFSGFNIKGNVFKRNVYNLRNDGTSSDLFIDGNTFVDGNIALNLSSGGTLGVTKTRFSNNQVLSTSSVLNFEAATYTGNEFYGNKIVSGATLTLYPSNIIFKKFLNDYDIKKISTITSALLAGNPWATGNLVTEIVTGFAEDPATAPYTTIYTVSVNPGSLADTSGVVITATPTGTANQVRVGFMNLSGGNKTVNMSGYINYSVTQIVYY